MPEAESMYSQMATIPYTTISKLTFGLPTKIRQPNSQHKQTNFLPNNFPHGLFFFGWDSASRLVTCWRSRDMSMIATIWRKRRRCLRRNNVPCLIWATGAVNGTAGFAVFCCRIARQWEVVPVSLKLRASVRSCARQFEVVSVSLKLCPSVRSRARQFEVVPVSLKLCPSVWSCARQFEVVPVSLKLCPSVWSCARQFEVVPVSLKLCPSVWSCARQLEVSKSRGCYHVCIVHHLSHKFCLFIGLKHTWQMMVYHNGLSRCNWSASCPSPSIAKTRLPKRILNMCGPSPIVGATRQTWKEASRNWQLRLTNADAEPMKREKEEDKTPSFIPFSKSTCANYSAQ